jgi:hypothetical protein
MKIKPVNKCGSSRQGTLSNITVDEINEILGFTSNAKDDPDKVVNSWGFTADGVHCGIWDYKGSHQFKSFSTYGPDKVFKALFGDRYGK